MRKLFLAVILLLSSLGLHAQTTAVTINLKTVLGESLGTNTFVRFRLRNFKPNSPRVTGTGIIVQVRKDVSPDSNGLVSTNVFENSAITPSGTFYTLEYYFQGRFVQAASYTISGTSFDVNSAAALSEVPVAKVLPTQVFRSFVHNESPASTTWTVNHSFSDVDTPCEFYNSSNQRIFPDLVTQTDANNVTANWVLAQAGKAICWNLTNFSLLSGVQSVIVTNPTANQAITGGFRLTHTGDLVVVGNVLPNSVSTVPWLIKGLVGQTADLLKITDNSDNALAQFLAGGGLKLSDGTNLIFDFQADGDITVRNWAAQNLTIKLDAGTGGNNTILFAFNNAGVNRGNWGKNSTNALFFDTDNDLLIRSLAGTQHLKIHTLEDKISFGSASDTSLERSAANTLKVGTGDTLLSDIIVSGNTNNVRVVHSSGQFTTIQAAIDDASTNSTVLVTSNQTLSAELAMRSGIRLVCISRGIVITQANSANLTNMINFSTNSADDASIENCTIDGNRANNSSGNSLINLSTRSRNKVLHNIIQNAPASGVIMQAGTGVTVAFNEFDAISDNAIQFQPVTAFSTNSRVIGNRCTRWGAGCIKIIKASGNEVALNHGDGTQIISVVDTATSTVTWVSGTQFSTLLSGMFANVDGTETKITSVDSATQITVAADLGSQSSVAMIAGSGDGITVNTGSDNLIAENHINNSMSNGFVVNNSVGTLSPAHNRLIGNYAKHNGDVGFWIADDDGGSLTIDSTLLSGNMAAENGIAGHSLFDAGFKVSGTSPNDTAFDGNMCRDSQGTPTQLVCIAMDSSTGVNNVIGNNYTFGAMTPIRNPERATVSGFTGPFRAFRYFTNGTTLVAGDFSLSGTWGTTATVTSVVGDDQKFRFTANSSGTGQGASPTITMTYTDGTWALTPIIVCNRGGGSQQTVPITSTSTATAVTLTFVGTPVDTESYTINCIVMGDA